jgi:hypothetical protein
MSTEDTVVLRPEVADFIVAVRGRLTDLPVEEQQDLTEGLEADLAELVAERGTEALGDPAAYAAELRAAAGLSPVAGPNVTRQPVGLLVHGALDATRATWDRLVAGIPFDLAGFLTAVRPIWWVFRAWVAVELGLLVTGNSYWGLSVVPDSSVVGALVTLVAMVLSVQLGRGRLWPGERWRASAGMRVLLLGLNGFALVATPYVFGSIQLGYNRAVEQAYGPVASPGADGLNFQGNPVRNIYPYDAAGHPLVGIQLVDDSGRRLNLTNDPYGEGTGWGDFKLIPWLNGRTELLSVFPLAEQKIDQSVEEPSGDPALQVPPFATLPPVTLSGVTPSTLVLQPPTP